MPSDHPSTTTAPPLHSYLRRLPHEFYRGKAAVHWSMTMQGRATGWLDESFHHTFRETLTHTAFLYHLAIPIYCLMPDHLHLLALGYCNHPDTDQRLAIRFLRTHLTHALRPKGVALQKQPYDHVVSQDEAFENVAWYIRENPLRANLVGNEDCASGVSVPRLPAAGLSRSVHLG